MISAETSQIVIGRTNIVCENPCCKNRGMEIHHIYKKSEYNKDDRDEPWNLALLCKDCHTQGKKALHPRNLNQKINHILNKYLKSLADKRKPKEGRSKNRSRDLIRAKKQRRTKYLKDKEMVKKIKAGEYKQSKPTYNIKDLPF